MNSSVWLSDISFCAINGASVLVCLLAAVLVFALKLHRKVVYRLALYQVLSSLAFAMVEMLQIIFINYGENPEIYGRVCTAIGWLGMYTRWVKLLFTMWLVFHLFCFGVVHKSLDSLEALYVVTSLLAPAVMAAIPLTTNSYGRSPFHSYCYISGNGTAHARHVELAEKLGVWDAPAMVMLMVASFGMVVLVVRIAALLCQKGGYEPISGGGQYWKAFKELLPLAAFPILFFICVIPPCIFHIYSSLSATNEETPLAITALVFTSMWSLASGLTLIIHLSVARCFAKKKAAEADRHSTYAGYTDI
eukprot:Em0007g340a